MESCSRLALILLICILLASCSQVSEWNRSLINWGKEDWREGALQEFTPQLKLENLWQEKIGGSNKGQLKRNLLLLSKYLFTCDVDGKGYAFSALNGERLWQTEIAKNISFCVGGGSEALLFGTAKGEVIALDSKSGKRLWRKVFKGGVVTAISRDHQGIVLVRNQNGDIRLLKINNGEELWSIHEEVPSLTIQGMSTPVFYEQYGFVGLDDGRLLVIELKDGMVIEEVRVGLVGQDDGLGRIIDIDGVMAVSDGTVFVASYQGRTLALDLERKKVLWFTDVSSQRGLYVDEKRVYLANENGEMVALDRFVGSEVWKNTLFSVRDVSPPTSYAEWVVIGDNEGNMFWLAQETGDVLVKYDMGDAIHVAPIHYQGKVIALDEEGTLSAFKVVARYRIKKVQGNV